MSKVVTYVEIDIPMCSLSYGEGACTASGGPKCFNSLGTCQARGAFDLSVQTLRLTDARAEEDPNISALPCLERADTQTNKISLGEDLGIRSSVNIVCGDFRYSDAGPLGDKYLAERGWDAYDRGTFWSRFRMRHPYMRGRNLRVYRGELGKPLVELSVRYFTVNSILGPGTDGKVSITGQDVLKFADGDRSQAPRPSEGFLLNDIDKVATSISLMPTGIGDVDYPLSGLVAIGGGEVCEFTRAGDTLTLVRGARETDPVDHKAGDRAQVCLEYSGWSPADIISDLLVRFADVDPSLIPLSDWQVEVETHLRRLYTRTIAEPTSVRKLISELIKQAALAVWHDDTSNLIRMQVLKPLPVDAGLVGEDVYLQNTASVNDQPDKRISTCQVLYGLKSPLMKTDSPESYRSMALVSDIQGQADYGSPAIEVVYGSWIPAYARQVASRLGTLRVGRYSIAPRKITAEVHKMAPLIPELGGGYYFTSWPIQDASGMPIRIPVQITSVTDMMDKVRIEAEEATFLPIDEEDLTNRTITLDGNALNVDLRRIHDNIYPVPTTEDTIKFIIPSRVIIGSRSASEPAVTVGIWPPGVVPDIEIYGRIQGKGGDGANHVRKQGTSGGPGGGALYARSPITVSVSNEIWGGGGGGSSYWGTQSGGGGGGQGYLGGRAGIGYEPWKDGRPGSPEEPGEATFEASRGGYAGQAAPPIATQPGGAAGYAINGNSFVTFLNGEGDIRGPRSN